jgi:hypothetical protein
VDLLAGLLLRPARPAPAAEGEGHVNSLVGLINGAWRYLHRPRANAIGTGEEEEAAAAANKLSPQ